MLEKFKNEYPINLVIDLYDRYKKIQRNSRREYTKDELFIFINKFDYNNLSLELNKLNTREKHMILLRYEYKYSYNQIAKLFELSDSRIRQIVDKSQYNINRNLFKNEENMMVNAEAYNNLIALNSLNNKKYNDLLSIAHNHGINVSDEIKSMNLNIDYNSKYIKIKDLNLSTKTHNSLTRSGINNLNQLMSYTRDDLFKLRNFGQFAYDELYNKLLEEYHLIIRN